ncbi:hypothetical protein MIMGU_mgv11b014703mg [Erythranthe guttata]|uniref:Uncharacterized protein n=1 Tax=Erythranthe guttata TaxID=4155 RepID=A0A022PUC1_ERYGU|nr:hypothetical protein MIMGU_mgv11b014703mg [Erythranthe guttata]
MTPTQVRKFGQTVQRRRCSYRMRRRRRFIHCKCSRRTPFFRPAILFINMTERIRLADSVPIFRFRHL